MPRSCCPWLTGELRYAVEGYIYDLILESVCGLQTNTCSLLTREWDIW